MNLARIAFLGGMYPDDTKRIREKALVGLDYAADAYQKKYLTCFRDLGLHDIKIFSRLFLGNFPLNNIEIFIRERGASQFGDIEYIDYFNLILFRNRSWRSRTVKAVSEWYRSEASKDSTVLFVYSAGFSKEIIQLKKKHPKLKVCLIIPDLPRFTYLSEKTLIRKIRRATNEKWLEESCRVADYCICITEKMKEYLSTVTGISCSVVEAIADRTRCEKRLSELQKDKLRTQVRQKCRIIAYTGTLARKYGILDLLHAFEQMQDKNCELHICGDGDAVEEVVKASQTNPHICYHGAVSHETSQSIQDSADILVNPRNNEGAYTAYSFPSKTMEYLETGNTVVCYDLDGIPKEYHKLVVHPKGSSIKDLADALDQASDISSEERINAGCETIEYLLKNKCGSVIREVLDTLTALTTE